MNFKELLGENYREDISLAEISELLAGYDPTKGMISKSQFDKLASELATTKKQLKERMTAEEQAVAERKAEQDKMAAELAELKKEKVLSEHKARLLGLGYEESLAADTARALVEGNMDEVFANQKKHLEAQEKALRAQLLTETPKPPAGSSRGYDDFSKQIEAANAAGDFGRMAALMRQQQEAQMNK